MMGWKIIATKTGLDREVVARGLATKKEAWEWKIMHAEKFTPRVLYLEREEEKRPTLKELFTGVTLDTWLERAKVKGLNEFKNEVVKSPEQETLETPFVWRAFREWVKRSLREDADVKIILETLDDIDKKFTYSEAQDFLMKTDDPKFAWIRMQFKDVEEMKESPLVSEMRKTIEGARRAGITDRQLVTALRSMGIELERPTSKGLAEARKEIGRLTEEIKRLQMEKIIPEWKPYWTEQEKAVELGFREYPSEETYWRQREARALLERAIATDPYITMWLKAHHFTVRDLEDEVVRLTRAVAGGKVPSYTLDVVTMSEDVAEKQRKMPTLMEMELILEGAQKKEKWALERMEAKYGVTNVYEFEGKVVKLREEVGDPSQEGLIVYLHRFCPRCRDRTRYRLTEFEGELYWECERCGRLVKYGSPESETLVEDFIPVGEIEEAKKELFNHITAESPPPLFTSSTSPQIRSDIDRQFIGTLADTEAALGITTLGYPMLTLMMVDSEDVQRLADLCGVTWDFITRVSKRGIPYKVYYTHIVGARWVEVADQYTPFMYIKRKKNYHIITANKYRYLLTSPMSIAKRRTEEERLQIARQILHLREIDRLTYPQIAHQMTLKGYPMQETTALRYYRIAKGV